jgi:hypothetical protein
MKSLDARTTVKAAMARLQIRGKDVDRFIIGSSEKGIQPIRGGSCSVGN